MMTSEIFIRDMHVYARHGVMEQERQVGAWFTISLTVAYNFSAAIESDLLDDTISYDDMCQLVQSEMDVPSLLLEHVAGRIVKAIQQQWPQVLGIDLSITKDNPPMKAACAGAGVRLCTGSLSRGKNQN